MTREASAGAGGGASPPLEWFAGLAAASLGLAAAVTLGYPPEVWPASGVAVGLLLAIGLVAAGRRLPLPAVLVAAGFLLVNLAVSLSPGRTIDAVARLVLPTVAFLVASSVARRSRPPVLFGIAAVGASLGFVAVLQKGGLLAREAVLARELGLAAEVIYRLEQERAFATHALPAALAGALVAALFAAGAAAVASRGRGRAALLGLCGAMCVVGLLMTASIGGLLGLAAGGAVVLVPPLGRGRGRRVLLAVLVLVALSATVLALRPEPVFELERPNHPLKQRIGNWRAAAELAVQRPSVGLGLGSYGAVMPAVREARDSATAYAHNSWLQLVVEGGIPAAVLLAAGALALMRRLRGTGDASDRWLMAGATAFAAHNLVDFTAYLPGVSVTSMTLAGLVFAKAPAAADERRSAAPTGARGGRAGAVIVAAAAAASAALFAGEFVARPALPWSADASAADATPPASAVWRASRFVPFNPVLLVRAGRLLSGSPEWRSAAARLAIRAAWDDPESPAPWHLLGRLRLAQGRASDSWRALAMAARRHPADPSLRESQERLERELLGRGWLGDRPGDEPRPPEAVTLRASSWDQTLLLLHVAALILVGLRWVWPRGAPAEAIALAAVVLLVAWGDGGSLPGARLGRHLLLGGAVLAWLVPRRASGRDAARRPGGVSLAPILLLLPAASWAACSTAFAPDRAAARDGLLSLVAALVVLVVSWDLSRRFAGWRTVLCGLFSVTAFAAAAVLLLQRGAIAAGADPTAWPAPLRVVSLGPLRPAGDFLHPGHLGTFLVACGLMLLGSGLPGRREGFRPLRLAPGAALVLAGLASGARASLVALLAGGLVLIWATPHRRARRLLLAVVAVFAIVGSAWIANRFSSGAPHAFDRLSIWPASMGAAATRPLLGFGPDGFRGLAASFAFPDPDAVAHYGKQFRGPHSDLIGAVLLLGVPGAALLLGALAAFGWRCLRAARDGPLDAGLLAALAALAAHASVDDLFGARPAAALAAAMLLGACAGRREATESVRPARAPGIWTPSVAARLAVGVSVVALLLGAELRPYAAFRARSAGDPTLAAALDPASATNLLAAARSGVGSPAERFLHADDGTWRAVRAAPANPHVRAARAELLSRACLGSLPEIGVCESAIASWSGALALRPHDVQSRRARARLQMLLGRPGTAIADFRLAIHDEPSYLGARDDLVRALEETGRPRAAARERSARRQVIEGLEGFRPMSRYERMLLTRDEPPPAARPDDGRGRGTREAADDRRSDVARERLAP